MVWRLFTNLSKVSSALKTSQHTYSTSQPIQPSLDTTVERIGHRGARGKRPENSIPSFQYCLEQGMTSIEFDLNLTKDKQLIIHHDTALNGKICTTPTGQPAKAIPIRELTVSQLKAYDCGSRKNADFPEQLTVAGTQLITIDEFFEFVKQFEDAKKVEVPVRFNIEIKVWEGASHNDISEMARLVVNHIGSAGMDDRSTVQSFSLEVLAAVKNLNLRLRTAALFEPTRRQWASLKAGLEANRDQLIADTLNLAADTLGPNHVYINPAFVRLCHRSHLKVIPWTVNDVSMMQKFLNWGVDGIITDYPDRLRHVYVGWKQGRQA
jgi:glycerophosphoryl diester phosphodiesterase